MALITDHYNILSYRLSNTPKYKLCMLRIADLGVSQVDLGRDLDLPRGCAAQYLLSLT